MFTNTPKAKCYRRALAQHEKQYLFAILVRHVREFKDKLPHEEVADSDRTYAVLWRATLKAAQEHGAAPDQALLRAGIEKRLRKARQTLSAEENAEIDAILARAFGGDQDGPADRQEALRYLKRYRAEAASKRFLRTFRGAGWVARDVSGALAAAKDQLDAIDAMHLGGLDVLFPEGWDRDLDIGVFSTGISFLDALLEGGHAPGEVYGLLGPYGSCKTTLAVMLACEAARQARAVLHAGGPHEYAVLVSYEATKVELQRRVLSYAAQIELKSLRGMKGLKSLSTSANLKEYEQEMFKAALAAGKSVLGERDRAKQATAWLNEHLVVFDFSGADPRHHSTDGGYIDAIVNRINERLLSGGKDARARLVVIDYVGAMANRYLMAQHKRLTALRHVISSVPLDAKSRIAIPFNCPVWLLHQLSAEANAPVSWRPCDHTHAAEAKNFGEHLDFAMVVGNENEANLRQIVCTRHRRTSGDPPPRVIRVEGALSRVAEVGAHFAAELYAQTVGNPGILEANYG